MEENYTKEDFEQKEYKHKWKVRKTQIIVVSIISAVLSIFICIDEGVIIATPIIWVVMTYLISMGVVAIASMFKAVRNIYCDPCSSAGFVLFEVMITGGAVALYEMVAFPFTTIYYHVKNKKESAKDEK